MAQICIYFVVPCKSDNDNKDLPHRIHLHVYILICWHTERANVFIILV